ncbi:MAG: hypothetical protein ACRCY4_01595 [Brevinema sp.]
MKKISFIFSMSFVLAACSLQLQQLSNETLNEDGGEGGDRDVVVSNPFLRAVAGKDLVINGVVVAHFSEDGTSLLTNDAKNIPNTVRIASPQKLQENSPSLQQTASFWGVAKSLSPGLDASIDNSLIISLDDGLTSGEISSVRVSTIRHSDRDDVLRAEDSIKFLLKDPS